MLHYEYDQELLNIEEQLSGQDVEFWLRMKRPDAGVEKAVKQVRAHFDQDDMTLDVLFYAHPQEAYQWIMRQDAYMEFVMCLFKHRLFTSIRWN